MMGNSFAQEWAGREAWPHRGHLHGLQDWAFAKGKGKGHHERPSREEIEQMIAMRGMRGGPFGGQGPFGGGPRGRGRGGRARRGDVRLGLLLLLAEEPRNGYQLMQTIEERSGGRWRPSPGSVYPTLSQLEDEGLIRATEADGARQFEITDAGREHLASRSEEPPPWEVSDEAGGHALPELAPLIVQIGKAAWQVAQVGNEHQTARATEVLTETRRALYRILADDGDGGGEDDESAA
jgi:DNA-binding PadR family transcriptional regulator